MNFGAVLETFSKYFDEKGFLYAVVGGVALAAYGLPRMTIDLDFTVEARAQDDLIRFLESRGYQALHRSSGYSNHKHPDPDWDRLDFIYVKDETSRELFAEPSDRSPYLDWDVPTTPGDVQALRDHRPTQGPDWWERFQEAVDQLPGVQEALRKRPTFEGCPPFEL